MADINSIMVSGNVGRDPEMKYSSTGTAYLKFSLACNQGYKKDEKWIDKTDWYEVIVWRKYAEYLNEQRQLRKGAKVTVIGTPKVDAWKKKGDDECNARITINAREVVVPNKMACDDDEEYDDADDGNAWDV